MQEFDRFERLLCDALRSEEQPPAGFAGAVMARVAVTPQKKKAVPYGRYIAAAAACLVLVYLGTIPLRWRAGSAAPQNASSSASSTADFAPAEAPAEAAEEFTMETPAAPYGDMREDAAEPQDSQATASGAEAEINEDASQHLFYARKTAEGAGGVPVYTVSDPAVCAALRQWLDGHGYVDDGGYILYADDVAAMGEALPDYALPDGDCVLILEA